jgi:hypothetical protein
MNNSKKQTGRIAGILYLVLAVTAAIAIVYVPSKIHGEVNASQTVSNILKNEFLYRSGIISHLISQVVFIFLGVTLYRLLKEANENIAKLMFALILVQVPIVFIAESFKLTALMVAKGHLLQHVPLVEAHDTIILLLKTHGNCIVTLELFWGLWLIPFGLLVYKSGFISKLLGILLLSGGIAYIFESLALLLNPDIHAAVVNFTMIIYSIAEIAIIFWLLIVGAKKEK